MQRRYTSGFAFQTSYTYGVAKDMAGSAMIVEQPGLDYGYAAFDIRHKLAMNFVWEIPYEPANAVANACWADGRSTASRSSSRAGRSR